MKTVFRSIPATDKSINELLRRDPELASIPRSRLKDLVTDFWNLKREEFKKGLRADAIDLEREMPALSRHVREALKPGLRPVLNGTGVIIHTNLGRSILADKACEAIGQAARSYCNLEMDLNTGERGSRQALISDLICKLTGGQAAMVVNNNAAAVLLILDSLCKDGETIVSRGELVEIGGSFRIPDIMRKSGSTLREVGTTNRTRLEDYSNAINERTKAIMRVHASNFRIIGFHSEADLKDLKILAHAHNLPLIFDLGSGNLLDFSASGLPPEPDARQVLAKGADLVCFSGDKALGGPQAGIIVGKADLVEKLQKNPLARALRCDKLCLAALEATLLLYLNPDEARKSIPTVAMINMGGEELAKKARGLAGALRRAFGAAHVACEVKLIKDNSRVGGGSFPECGLPTTLVALYPQGISSQDLRDRLLKTDVPLVGRLEKEAFCLDPRTLAKADFKAVIQSLLEAFAQGSNSTMC